MLGRIRSSRGGIPVPRRRKSGRSRLLPWVQPLLWFVGFVLYRVAGIVPIADHSSGLRSGHRP